MAEVKAHAMLSAIKQRFLAYHHRTCRIPLGERVVASFVRQTGRTESLLDVGCGDGVTTRALADALGAARVAGVDVLVRPAAVIDVHAYDGRTIPFGSRSFDTVSLIDVLHHCREPLLVLREAIRVAAGQVLIKDHFAFGPVTKSILLLMDLVGNSRDSIPSPGHYLSPSRWVSLIQDAGGRIVSLEWPLKIHDVPWRIIGWPEIQFSAKIVAVR